MQAQSLKQRSDYTTTKRSAPAKTRALSGDQLTCSHPNVQWHFAGLNAGWLSPSGYYWILKAWGHTSSDASGGGPCRHTTSVALAADLTCTWAVAILGSVPDREGVAASLPLQYGAHQPWLHTVTPRSSFTSYDTRIASRPRGSPRARRR